MGVPSSKAEVQAANTSPVAVDNQEFFVMRPDFDSIDCTNMIGVALVKGRMRG